MGKSTAALYFRLHSVPVFDSDFEVQTLLTKNRQVIRQIKLWFPEAICDGMVNRVLLGQKVFGDHAALTMLESIIHPVVRSAREKFLRIHRAQRKTLVLLDIPLLYETQADKGCDYVCVVTAPWFVQKRRVLARPGMTLEKFRAIISHQMSDSKKRRHGDFIIRTGLGKHHVQRRARNIVRYLQGESTR